MTTTQDKKDTDRNGYERWYDVPMTKIGVFQYLGRAISPKLEPDKIYQVLRPEEELTNPETLKSLEEIPFIDEHTMLGEGFTPAEEKGIHGVTGKNVKVNGVLITNDLIVYSKTLKDLIDSGKRDLSMGYHCKYDLTPGEYNGEHYDAIQRDVIFNHIALVEEGRMGSECRVTDSAIVYDSMEVTQDDWITVHPNGKEHEGRPLFVEEGESYEQAINRKYPKKNKEQITKKENTPTTFAKPSTTASSATNSEKSETKFKETSKEELTAQMRKEGKTLKPVSKIEKPVEVNKKEANGIEIKRETSKAYLLNKDGVNFWVQKRWYKDGELTPAGEKSFNEKKAEIEYNASLKNKKYRFKPSWESEKAYGVDVTFENNGGHKELYNVRVFVPKSQVKDGVIPHWLYEAKMKEAYEKAGLNAYWGDYGSGFESVDSKDIIYALIDGELYEIVKNSKQEEKIKMAKITLDEDLKQEIKEEIKKELLGNNEAPEDEAPEDEAPTADGDEDKRKLIDEIGGILKGKIDDELIRTIMQKAEELAYNPSETGANDCNGGKAVDEEPAPTAEPKKEEKKEEGLSMDAAIKYIAKRDELVSKIRPIIGDNAKYSSMNIKEVVKYACDKLDIPNSQDRLEGYLAGLNKSAKASVKVSMDSFNASNDFIQTYKNKQ